MKKIILFCTIIFSLLVSGKTFTQEEKKEIIRQFNVFQKAVENKDIKTVTSMMELPLYESFLLMASSDNKFPEEYSNWEAPLTKKDLEKYKENVFYNLETVTYVKADPATGKVINYYKDNATEEDKKRKYYYDKGEDSYYYMEKSNKIYLENSRIWDDTVELSFAEDYIYVMEESVPNKLTPKKPEGDGGIVYEFKFENNKLKFYQVYWND